MNKFLVKLTPKLVWLRGDRSIQMVAFDKMHLTNWMIIDFTGQYFLSWAVFAKGRDMNCVDDQWLESEYHFPVTIDSRKLEALCLGNGITNIRNETQGAGSGLAKLFWDELQLYRVKRLNEWEHEKLKEGDLQFLN